MPVTTAPDAGPLRLRARWVLPIDAPPIENGEVVVEGERIVQVGPADLSPGPSPAKRGGGGGGAVAPPSAPGAGRGKEFDFGAAAILPGFVNVHTHLEYTVFRGLLEDIAFFPWIRTLTRLKAHLTYEDWLASATLGAAEMLQAGVTTVGDCADAGATLDALITSGLRGTVFREVFGIAPDEPEEDIVAELARKVAAMRERLRQSAAAGRVEVGISPHAPYTVRGALFAPLAGYARREGLRQAIHIAESPAEDALLRSGTGPFAEMFARRALRWQAPGLSPARYVAEQGGLYAPALAVHCVHTDGEDAALLAARGAAVAHCPKSNGKLGAGVAPLRTLLDAGLAVGLGTDSMASNNAADLFEEMRAALFGARARERDAAALTAPEALHLATLGGARALGMGDRIGSLAPGKRADLCVVRLDGLHIAPATDEPVSALVYSARASDVRLTMVDGRVLYDAGGASPEGGASPTPTIPVAAIRDAVEDARRRLREAVAGAA